MLDDISEAAKLISGADALIVAAGAGMGVDSGLPTFRGSTGFSDAFPMMEKLGLTYRDLASPAMFDRDPHLAWGFHGLCGQRYRSATPHAGFEILRRWIGQKTLGGFVYTSNIDGHFQRGEFDPQNILECHGSAHRWQCTVPCSTETWVAEHDLLVVDRASLHALDPLPHCRNCGKLARPNVRLFDDAQWVRIATRSQSAAYEKWKATLAGKSVVVIECGAGTDVPAVRLAGEWAMLQLKARLIRINPIDAEVPQGQISIPLPALQALAAVDEVINPGRAGG